MRLMLLSTGMLSCMAVATSLVALFQISMSSWRRSSSVIRPVSYWFWTFAAFASAPSRISPFDGRRQHVGQRDRDTASGWPSRSRRP